MHKRCAVHWCLRPAVNRSWQLSSPFLASVTGATVIDWQPWHCKELSDHSHFEKKETRVAKGFPSSPFTFSLFFLTFTLSSHHRTTSTITTSASNRFSDTMDVIGFLVFVLAELFSPAFHRALSMLAYILPAMVAVHFRLCADSKLHPVVAALAWAAFFFIPSTWEKKDDPRHLTVDSVCDGWLRMWWLVSIPVVLSSSYQLAATMTRHRTSALEKLSSMFDFAPKELDFMWGSATPGPLPLTEEETPRLHAWKMVLRKRRADREWQRQWGHVKLSSRRRPMLDLQLAQYSDERALAAKWGMDLGTLETLLERHGRVPDNTGPERTEEQKDSNESNCEGPQPVVLQFTAPRPRMSKTKALRLRFQPAQEPEAALLAEGDGQDLMDGAKEVQESAGASATKDDDRLDTTEEPEEARATESEGRRLTNDGTEIEALAGPSEPKGEDSREDEVSAVVMEVAATGPASEEYSREDDDVAADEAMPKSLVLEATLTETASTESQDGGDTAGTTSTAIPAVEIISVEGTPECADFTNEGNVERSVQLETITPTDLSKEQKPQILDKVDIIQPSPKPTSGSKKRVSFAVPESDDQGGDVKKLCLGNDTSNSEPSITALPRDLPASVAGGNFVELEICFQLTVGQYRLQKNQQIWKTSKLKTITTLLTPKFAIPAGLLPISSSLRSTPTGMFHQ